MSAVAVTPQTSAAYRSALLALQRQQRAQLATLIQQTEAALHEDWTRGPGIVAQYYTPLIDQYARALNDLRIAEDDPAAKLSLDWLTSHNESLRAIETNVKYNLDKFASQSTDAITAAQRAAANAGLTDAGALTQEALSPAWEKGVNPSLLFSRPNPDAIGQWVGRAGNGHPLGDLFDNFSQEAASGARQAMLFGLATGANPQVIARGIQDAMGISRSRALTISRTEVLGSYRAAAHDVYRANSDVLNYWLWSAGGANPCAMCMGMDGTLHSLDESLDDHPCGKCAPLPVTKSWADILGPLGIDASDLDETSIGAPGAYETGEEKFAKMSPERQERIIGTKTGYEAYQRGEVSLRDFVGVRPAADGFPSSYYQRSLKDLQIPTRQAGRLVEPSPQILEKLRLGTLRARDLGQITPDALMPAWAKESEASRVVYQILRNGLPYDMTSHEQGLLITNLEQMLRGELPVNVRAAAERQLQALGQSVERQTVGKAAAEREIEQVTLKETDAAIEAATGREATHIAEEDVATFTANNAPDVPAIGYHYGAPGHIARLGEEGIDVERNLVGAFGRGFYMFGRDLQTVDNEAFVADAASRYGTENVRVAIHIENPFRFTSQAQWSEIFDQYASGGRFEGWEERFTADLLKEGYDGIIIPASDLEDPFMPVEQIVAIKPGTVRVIQDEAQALGQTIERAYAPAKTAMSDAEVAARAEVKAARSQLSSLNRKLSRALEKGQETKQLERDIKAATKALEKAQGKLDTQVALRKTQEAAAKAAAKQAAKDAKAAERLAAREAAKAAKAAEKQAAVKETDTAIREATGRAATHIEPEDVAKWTANNAEGIPSIGYHASTPEGIASIRASGVDIEANVKGLFGKGFYMHTELDPSQRFGADVVQVAIHMEKPFIIENSRMYGDLAEKYYTVPGYSTWQDAMRADLLRQGYDGILVRAEGFRFGPNDKVIDEVIAIKPGTVRVIDEAAKAAEKQAAQDAARLAGDVDRLGFNVERMSAQELKDANQQIMGLIRVAENNRAAAQRTLIKAENALADGLRDNADFQKVGDALVNAYAHEMAREGYSAKDIADMVAASSYSHEEVVEALVRAWATGGGNETFVALQQAVSDEFGLENAAKIPGSTAKILRDWQEAQPGLRAFVRQMYNNTQDYLREHGITEIPVYRGMGFERLPRGAGITAKLFDGQAQEIRISLRAASSFSADPAMALRFANSPVSDINEVNYALVMAARVPAEAVLSIPQTGFGALREFEVVTIGGQQDAVMVGIKAAQGELTPEQVNALLVARANESAFAAARAQVGIARAEANYDLTATDKAFVAEVKRQVEALDQGALTHHDALDIGGQMHERILADPTLTSYRDYAAEAQHIWTAGADNLSDAERAWARGDPEAIAAHDGVKWVDAQARYQAEFQARALAYLGEMRDMGGAQVELDEAVEGFNADAAAAVQRANTLMPTEWVEASNDLGKLGVILNDDPSGAGYFEAFADGSGNIALSAPASAREAEGLQSLGLHEMMHRMEQVIPRISQLEEQFYNARTAGDALVNLTNGIRAKTKLDNWIDEYLGRAPLIMRRPSYLSPLGFERGSVEGYELLSMGAEMLLGGGSGTFDPLALREDEEFVNFILGLFALIRAESPEVLP